MEQAYGLKITVDQSAKKYLLKEGLLIRESHDLSSMIESISLSPPGLTTVEFYPTGKTSAAGTFALQSRYNDFLYVVILNTTGRVRVSSTPP